MRTPRSTRRAIATVLTLALATVAHAAPFTAGNSAPNGNVVTSYSAAPNDNSSARFQPAGRVDMGQTWTAPADAVMDTIAFHVNQSDFATAAPKLAVQVGEVVNNQFVPITTRWAAAPTITAGQYLTLDIHDIRLEQGHTYYASVGFAAESANNRLRLNSAVSTNANYPGDFTTGSKISRSWASGAPRPSVSLGSGLGKVEAGTTTTDLNFWVQSPTGAAARDVQLRPLLLPGGSPWVRVGDPAGQATTDPAEYQSVIDRDGHYRSVESAEFSPDGTLIVSASKADDRWRNAGNVLTPQQARVRVWDVATGNMLFDLTRSKEVEAIAFSPNGKFIAAGGEDFNVLIHRIRDNSGNLLATPQLVATLNHPGGVEGLRFSHDGARLATVTEAATTPGSQSKLTIWNTSALGTVAPAILDQENGGGTGGNGLALNQVDWAGDDSFLITGGKRFIGTTGNTEADMKRWFINSSGTLTLAEDYSVTGAVSAKAARISPGDGQLAFGARGDKGALLWTTGDNSSPLHQLVAGQYDTIEAVEFTPDGRYLAVGGYVLVDGEAIPAGEGFSSLQVFDTLTMQQVFATDVFQLEYLHFSPDGSKLVSSHEDGTIRVWELTVIPEPATLGVLLAGAAVLPRRRRDRRGERHAWA